MIDNYIAIVITTLSKNIYMIFTITGYIQPNTPIGYHTELISEQIMKTNDQSIWIYIGTTELCKFS
jgi:hypothetical protein